MYTYELPNFFPHPYQNILSIMFISPFFIFSYGKWRSLNPEFKDPLMKKLGVWNLDGWSVLHFLWYGGMGYLYPENPYFILGLGMGWEAFEHILGETRPAILGGFGDCKDNINVKNNEKWWYGRFSDIIMNTAGFYAFSRFT